MTDLISYPDESRVWIYASDQKIDDKLLEPVTEKINQFTRDWTSHQQSLRASGGLLHNYFLVFVVDDGFNKPGGCSIDSSVRFVKQLGEELQVDFFNRNIFYYLQGEVVNSIAKEKLKSELEEGLINENTLFFDTLVQTKSEFLKHWLKPLQSSWHARLI